MGRRPKAAESSVALPPSRPSLNPENQQNKMISLAMDLVEERIRNKTATSQETTLFLKLATSNAELERKKLEKEIELLETRIQSMQAADKREELLERALEAFKTYSGYKDEEYIDY